MDLRMAVDGVMRTRAVNLVGAADSEGEARLSPRVALLGILGISTALWAMVVYVVG